MKLQAPFKSLSQPPVGMRQKPPVEHPLNGKTPPIGCGYRLEAAARRAGLPAYASSRQALSIGVHR